MSGRKMWTTSKQRLMKHKTKIKAGKNAMYAKRLMGQHVGLRLKKNRRRVLAGAALKSAGHRAKGAVLSKIRCFCGKRISLLAQQFGDPYCSRECMERANGIVRRVYKEDDDHERAKGSLPLIRPSAK